MQTPLLDLKTQYATIKGEIQEAINEVLDSGQFILGPTVERLEEEVANYSNCKYAVGVASCTDALLLSLRAFDVGIGDEVITTSCTFFATAGPISRLGATPVFVDIDPKTYNINPDLIEEQITKKTKAIIPVHLYGQCADMDSILEIAKRHNLKVVEDAAQAIGAEYKGRKAGSMGDTGCFSFFPTKNLGAYGDGGIVVTDDEEIVDKIRILRVHGSKPKYFHSMIGYNSRLDALQAAVLRVKLKYLDRWSEARRRNAQRYNEMFTPSRFIGTGFTEASLTSPSAFNPQSSTIVTPYVESYNTHIYNQYIIRAHKRDKLRKYLKEKGIGTGIYYPLPLHLQECYKGLDYKEGDLPESEKFVKETLALPIYPELTQEQQDYIVKRIKEFLISLVNREG